MFVLKDNATRKTMGALVEDSIIKFWGLSGVVPGFQVELARGLSLVM